MLSCLPEAGYSLQAEPLRKEFEHPQGNTGFCYSADPWMTLKALEKHTVVLGAHLASTGEEEEIRHMDPLGLQVDLAGAGRGQVFWPCRAFLTESQMT